MFDVVAPYLSRARADGVSLSTAQLDKHWTPGARIADPNRTRIPTGRGTALTAEPRRGMSVWWIPRFWLRLRSLNLNLNRHTGLGPSRAGDIIGRLPQPFCPESDDAPVPCTSNFATSRIARYALYFVQELKPPTHRQAGEVLFWCTNAGHAS